jgi:hypothetical protein
MATSPKKQLANLLVRLGACERRRKAYAGLTPARAFKRLRRNNRDLSYLAIHVKRPEVFLDTWAVRDVYNLDHKAARKQALNIVRAYAKRRGWKL